MALRVLGRAAISLGAALIVGATALVAHYWSLFDEEAVAHLEAGGDGVDVAPLWEGYAAMASPVAVIVGIALIVTGVVLLARARQTPMP